mmetsp:Transcript_45218/g.125478  ORF Transcript_45218/g.125478 Transcript_45218/m.125478 type:complete len:224 (+) Transcript_45218:357-1028(+)
METPRLRRSFIHHGGVAYVVIVTSGVLDAIDRCRQLTHARFMTTGRWFDQAVHTTMDRRRWLAHALFMTADRCQRLAHVPQAFAGELGFGILADGAVDDHAASFLLPVGFCKQFLSGAHGKIVGLGLRRGRLGRHGDRALGCLQTTFAVLQAFQQVLVLRGQANVLESQRLQVRLERFCVCVMNLVSELATELINDLAVKDRASDFFVVVEIDGIDSNDHALC